MKFAGSGKITRQGQVTLPADSRKEMRVMEGDTVEFYTSENLIIVKKKPTPAEIFGTLSNEIGERFRKKGIKKAEILSEIDRQRKEKHAKA